jgi:HK97 family phage portal protein
MNRVQKWIADKVLGLKASPPPAGSLTPFGLGEYQFVNGTVTWIKDKLQNYLTEGYGANDIVYSGAMLVMDKVRCAPWGLYKIVDEDSLKRYNSIMAGKFEAKDWAEARRLRKKALEPMNNFDVRTGKLKDLMDWPNEYCTWSDQVADGAGWKMLTGNEMLWGDIIPAGANGGIPNELVHAPAQFTVLVVKRGWPQKVVGYQLSTGELVKWTKEEIMHLKHWNPDYDLNGSSLYGMSPLKAASKTLTRNNAAKKAGSVQLDNNGAVGIVYVDDPIVPSSGREQQRDLIKRDWAKEKTGPDNYGKVGFSGYKMGYVPVGMSLKDMDVSALENIDLRRLFNIWGIPSQLGNDPENKTFNNQKEAEKALTSRCALPHLISKRNFFNRKLQTDWGFKKVNVYVDFDMSVYPELQEDQGKKWEWVSQLPVSSAYKLELMGLDVPDDPNLDEILVNGNLVPLRDVIQGMADPLDEENDELNKAGLNDYLKVAK